MTYRYIRSFGLSLIALAVFSSLSLAQEAPPPLEDMSIKPPPLENHSVPPPAVNIPTSIQWMVWGEGAFDRARSENKLVYLDISTKWCKWCKVMEDTVYTDQRVVETLNRDFVPVFVDADRRPDISDRYNMGGWPSIAILSPTGRVLAGRTTMDAAGLLDLLATASTALKADWENVDKRQAAAEKAAKEARDESDKKQPPVPLSASMPVKVLNSINLLVDPEHGGYGSPDKFPMPEVIEFALYIYPKAKDYKDSSPKKAIELTLDGMMDGLLDGEEGGFFRYSTTPDWKSPHYEKLLSTNAGLMGLYMQAAQALGSGKYRKVGEAVANYLENTLYDKDTGAFFSSQASDEEYYKMNVDDRRSRKAPPVDRVLYADANGRAASGFLTAYRATGEKRYLKKALGVVDYIMGRLYKKGVGVRHYQEASGEALNLADQVDCALAADQAYQATGQAKYLKFAGDVAALMVKDFWDPEKGGFFAAHYESGTIGRLKREDKPQIENSRAAELMMDIYYLTGNKVYKQTAERTLAPYTPEFSKYTFWAAPFALAVERTLETTYEFTVIGKPSDPGTAALVKASYTFDEPDRVVLTLDPEKDMARLKQLGYEYKGKPVLYVCSDKTCFPPVSPGESLSGTREHIKNAREKEIGK